jgi:hypothetical protein
MHDMSEPKMRPERIDGQVAAVAREECLALFDDCPAVGCSGSP